MAVATPKAPEEFEEALNDLAAVDKMLKAGTFTGFVGDYARALVDRDQTIAQQAQEQIQAGIAQFLRDNPDAITNRLPVNPLDAGFDSPEVRATAYGRLAKKNGLYSKTAETAKLNGVFAHEGEFLRALSPRAAGYKDSRDLAAKLGKLQEVQNSFSTNVPSDGGFLVPEQFRSDLLMLALENSLVQPMATVIPMESQRLLIPTVDSTSNVSSVFGGIVCYWVDEATAPTESSGKFGQVVLDAKKLMAYCTAPQELVADASAWPAFLNQALPQALAFERDYRFMLGTGAGEPLGFINSPASVAVTAVSGQGANTIVVENLAAMYARMLPTSLNKAVWIASIDTFPQLATMALSVGTGGAPVWLAGGGVADGPPMTIYGRPVYFTEKTPALGTTGDIGLYDLSFYLVGDRQTMTAQASQDFLFSSDRIAYKWVERLDGRPWIQSAITPRNNSSNTLTPFVQLSSTRT